MVAIAIARGIAMALLLGKLVNSKIHRATTNRANRLILSLMLPVIVLERFDWLVCSESNAWAS